MADGTFAALLVLGGLLDMSANHCGTENGCLGRSDVTPRFAISAGEVLERQAMPAAELYVRYDLGHRNGPFGHAVGFSIGENGELWLGAGQTWKMDLGRNSPFYTELHAMVGLYEPNGGFDLGGPIEFRSGIEVGYENQAGWRYSISYDHRSNLEIYSNNPGIETVQARVSIPLK
ncbi:acyloxyacyl hydrolase [Cognatishimia sp. SS12]|uniref:acyloxyacyl hydrolase n=1 Tax=Cognatishimia sp. SS12 TaxID=2979465 RepID=UPI00232B843F|nr:acyloxyacyl hydrolase [Cognatishimia sp. SS12]MDC0736663.1 acyloxyacyl hydrolase [Cognatishimia sp. SS12]